MIKNILYKLLGICDHEFTKWSDFYRRIVFEDIYNVENRNTKEITVQSRWCLKCFMLDTRVSKEVNLWPPPNSAPR